MQFTRARERERERAHTANQLYIQLYAMQPQKQTSQILISFLFLIFGDFFFIIFFLLCFLLLEKEEEEENNNHKIIIIISRKIRIEN